MAELSIKDLVESKALDAKAMSAVRGGQTNNLNSNQNANINKNTNINTHIGDGDGFNFVFTPSIDLGGNVDQVSYQEAANGSSDPKLTVAGRDILAHYWPTY